MPDTFCGKLTELLGLIGWVLTIFKVVIPLIIIALAIFDLGKAAISNKPEDTKKFFNTLIWRLVGGVLIFLLPSIIMAVFGFVSGFSTDKKAATIGWDTCYTCITNPSECK